MVASKILIVGLLFALTLVSGVWLSHSGKPLNSVIFAIHKLVALATVIMVGVNIRHLYGAAEVSTPVMLSVIIVSALFFLALFISGAFLSFGKPMPQAVLRIHQVVPLPALISSTVAFYLLAVSKAFNHT